MVRSCIAMMIGVTVLFTNCANAGSLYQEKSFQSLTADRKAHQRGDLITVLVYENSSAKSAANTTAGRDAAVGLDVENPTRTRGVGIKTNNQVDGHGQTKREGSVLAQITVSVKSVAENGDLLIAGEQLLEVNNEKQQIKVEGRIRPQDVSDTNTVLSTRIADAKISYAGEGDLSDKQRPSWWQRCLSWFGL